MPSRPRTRTLLLAVALASLVPACRRFRARPRAVTAPPARAFRARGPADLVTGPNAAGRVGDAVLENRWVRAVVDDVNGGGGFALSGGQLLDLALRDDGSDEIGQVFSFLGRFPRQLRYREMRTETRADGTAAVIVRGEDPRTPGLEGETTYSLGPDDRAVTLTTTLANHGNAPTEVGLGDAIQWATAEHWAPGRGFTLRGPTDEPYLAGIGARSTYAYAAPHALSGTNGGNWSNPTQQRVTLAPGATVTFVRRLAVARGGDVAGAVAATRMVPLPAALRVRATDATSGAPLADVRVVLLDPAHANAPIAMGATNARGETLLAGEPGTYALEISAPGRAPETAPATRTVTLRASHTEALALRLGAQSTLRLTVLEDEREVPARVLVYGTDGGADPLFGPIGRADGARNAIVLAPRSGHELPLAPGRYRVVATRGPERTLGEETVEIAPGEHRELTLRVRHVIDTTGYVCGDFHTHQAPSLDAPVSLRDRVRAAAAEGLEVLAGTDHNVATDLGPAARDEGLGDRLVTLAGDEVSTDCAVRPAGHWNLYPLPVRADAPLGGAPALFELSPAALVARVREIAPGAVIQLNHPRSGAPTGAFDIVGFDPATARATQGELDPHFDAIEVWNGRFQVQAETVMLDWLSLLRTGVRITATANSDSHAIVTQEVGYPRTCVRVPADDPAQLTAADIVRGLRELRDVVITDGPFLRVTGPDGASAIGATLPAAPDGTVTLRVRVESPVWDAAETLETVHADGRIEPLAARWTRDADTVHGEATARISAREGFVLFRARGTARIAVLTDDPPLYPMALSNPVYFRAAQ